MPRLSRATLVLFLLGILALLQLPSPLRAADNASLHLAARASLDLNLPLASAQARAQYRMPGEFETQQALLLSCGGLPAAHADKIAEIALAVRRRIRVVVLCASAKQQESVRAAVRRRAPSLENIDFLQLPHDTRWVRDYGPTVLCATNLATRTRSKPDRLTLLVDWRYDETRPNDDLVPLQLANDNKLPTRRASQMVEGGNLLSNGQGLVVVSSAVLERNPELDGAGIERSLQLQTGATQVAILEPLIGEATGHVDMFVAFTSPSTVVVGQYSLEDDPANASILDHNAAVLGSMKAAGRPLRVVRIPMGRNDDGQFRSYTNCIFANGVLLMPSYTGDAPQRQRQCQAQFRRLLPGWQVVLVDASDLIAEGGALHCISLNLPSFRPRVPAVR